MYMSFKQKEDRLIKSSSWLIAFKHLDWHYLLATPQYWVRDRNTEEPVNI